MNQTTNDAGARRRALTPQEKVDLLATAPLDNTDYVVIRGTPAGGGTSVNWDGRSVGSEPVCGPMD